MGKRFDSLTPALQEWLRNQKMFFVATAPLAGDGHVNCSPKGTDTFRIIGDREVAYLDLTGSGIETVSHLQENGRIVIMFCAFEGSPKIVRLHGSGKVLYPGDDGFELLGVQFAPHPSTRAIIHVTLDRISDSCGFGVPRLDFVAHRDAMDAWAERKGPEGIVAYRREKNQVSIDGLRGYAGT